MQLHIFCFFNIFKTYSQNEALIFRNHYTISTEKLPNDVYYVTYMSCDA